MVILLTDVGGIILMAIGGYFIGEYWCLLLVLILMVISDYYISSYW